MTTRAGESKSPLFLEMFACQQCVDLFFPNKTPKLSRPVIFCINTALFPNSYSFPVTFKGTFCLFLHPATSVQTPLVTHPLPVSHVRRVIVGAPKANSTYSSSVRSPGAVYKCRVHSNPDRRCTEMDLGRGESHERVLCIYMHISVTCAH